MKKTLALVITLVMIGTTITGVAENKTTQEKPFSIAQKIKSFMLVNNPVALEAVKAASEQHVQEMCEKEFKYRIAMHRSLTQADREFITDNIRSLKLVVPEQSFCFYPLITVRYTKQYADIAAFDSIIKEDKIWVAQGSSNDCPDFFYDKDFSRVKLDVYGKNSMSDPISDEKTCKFLIQREMIEKMVKEQIKEEITDCKIIAIPYGATILYLKGVTTDYGIKLYNDPGLSKEAVLLESFKIYTMAELLQSCGNYKKLPSKEVFDIKPTYNQEGAALMADGIIQGNDKGLDPLKPLSRIEATTILVRALGLEQTPTQEESKFSDIPNGHWGVKYANIASDKGITKGVGDNKFAPDQRVDANQFSALLLRGAEAKEIDWQQALNILVEKGIITQENANTMDLFTRGDMAKIIYEARQKGLLSK